jgi:predicted metal-dependent phosphoesterase TrpH
VRDLPAAAPPAAGRADLHTHSTVSDGVLTPSELVAAAAARGLRALGLTDHDTTAGLAEAEAAAARAGIAFVPGVELGTGGDGDDVHLLGYFVERDDPDLLAALAEFARQRFERVERIVARLAAAGVSLDPDRVLELAGPGTAGRPHVARALIEAGYVADIPEAFERYLRAGRPGFVPRPKVTPERGIALVRAAGGVAVLAHPRTVADLEATLARLVPAGLGGLEVYYGEYEDATRDRLRTVADRWRLVPTGGSDFHGVGFKAGRELGGPPVPLSSVERLREAAEAVRRVGPRLP